MRPALISKKREKTTKALCLPLPCGMMHGTVRLVLQCRRFAACTPRKPGRQRDPVSGSCSGAVAGSSTPHTLSTRSPPRHPVRVKNRGTFEKQKQREKSKGKLRKSAFAHFIFSLLTRHGRTNKIEFFSEIKLGEKFDKTSLPDYIINGLKEIK